MAINQISNGESGSSVRNKLNQVISVVNLGVTTSATLIGSTLSFDKTNPSNAYDVDLSTLTGATGPAGPQGISGATGPQGIQGVVGPQGISGATGPQGIPGVVGPAGLEWTGSWSAETTYVVNDAVGYSGSSWFCISGITGGVNNSDPSVDTNTWALLALEGATGPTGPTGPQGPQGISGTTGIQGIQGIQGPSGGGNDWTGGTNYILVKAEGTDTQNAAELQTAYDLAISMSASLINRITIVASPGYYNSDSDFNMNEEYIDLVSLDGNRSIIFNGNGTINITATDTLVRGVDVLTKPFKIGHDLENLVIENCKGGDNSFGNTNDGTNLTINGKFIKCEGGNNSFGSRVIGNGTAILTVSGKFIDCVAGFRSFGAFNVPGIQNNPNITTLNITNAEFINCNAGLSSFGSGGNFFGLGSSIEIVGSKFINCKSSGQESFGYANHPGVSTLTINSSGNNDVQTVFENCEAFGPSFGSASSTVTNVVIGGNPVASSNPYRVLFKNCVSKFFFSSPPQLIGINSFGGNGALNFVELINCRAGDNSFGLTISGSKLENCIGGNNSFGKNGVSGIFINCKAGNSSFNDGLTNSSNVTGTFIDCTAENNSFKANFNLNGNFRNCTAGDNSFRNSTTSPNPNLGVNGAFLNCIGGDNSFGSGNENVIGDFTNCTAGDNSFGGGLSGTSSGTFANCTGGDNSFASSGGTASGTFNNCTGGDSSFGAGGTLSGRVIKCQLTSGTFQTPTGSGIIILGIDGNDSIINLTA